MHCGILINTPYWILWVYWSMLILKRHNFITRFYVYRVSSFWWISFFCRFCDYISIWMHWIHTCKMSWHSQQLINFTIWMILLYLYNSIVVNIETWLTIHKKFYQHGLPNHNESINPEKPTAANPMLIINLDSSKELSARIVYLVCSSLTTDHNWIKTLLQTQCFSWPVL